MVDYCMVVAVESRKFGIVTQAGRHAQQTSYNPGMNEIAIDRWNALVCFVSSLMTMFSTVT
jgi:hypothetical protein